MLAEDVQLELVGITEKSGATDVGGYLNNYARLDGIRLALGEVDVTAGRAAGRDRLASVEREATGLGLSTLARRAHR